MIWMIARREIVSRARTKPFQIFTAIMFLAVIGAAILIAILSGGDGGPDEFTIGLEGAGVAYQEALSLGSPLVDPEVVITDNGRARLEDGRLDMLFDGSTLIWEGFPDDSLDIYVRNAVQQQEFSSRAAGLGLNDVDLGQLFEPVELAEERLDGDDSELGVRIATAMVGAVGTFIMLQVWGSFLMMGVIEEKSSRVVEVLLSHISPRTLLSGKVLGLGVLAISQLLILVLGLVLGLSLVQDIDIPDGVWGSVPLLVVTFLLGYAFYAALYAAVGSTVSRQEDAQTAQLPAMLPMFVGYGIAVASISNPDSLAVKLGSFVPFTSPIVLPFRMAMANPPWWEVAVALGILAISVPIMLRIAGAIYRGSLLHTGSRIPLIQAFKNRAAGAD